MAELCNCFLTAKLRKRESGEVGCTCSLSTGKRQTFSSLPSERSGSLTLTTEEFESLRATMAERWGPVQLTNTITRVKSVCKYAFDNGLHSLPPGGLSARQFFGEEAEKAFRATQVSGNAMRTVVLKEGRRDDSAPQPDAAFECGATGFALVALCGGAWVV